MGTLLATEPGEACASGVFAAAGEGPFFGTVPPPALLGTGATSLGVEALSATITSLIEPRLGSASALESAAIGLVSAARVDATDVGEKPISTRLTNVKRNRYRVININVADEPRFVAPPQAPHNAVASFPT